MLEHSAAERFRIIKELGAKLQTTPHIEDEEFKTIIAFSKDTDTLIRSELAAILYHINDPRGEKLLLKLVKDKKMLVRTEACDSLCASSSNQAYQRLKKISSKDRCGLVRGYAISSLEEISHRINMSQDALLFLKNLLFSEKEVFPRVCLYTALVLLAESTCLDELLALLHTNDYRNRCAVVNSLSEIMNHDNCERIKNALMDRKRIEATRAVLSCIDDLLNGGK